ncbi:CDP-glycerol glycerophosphotransferase family protein [Marmoricola sp. URHA0025 HA25]
MTAAGAAPHLLRRTLESARSQRTPALEVVVVCLDADARRTAQQAAGDDTRVRILEAGTVAAARRLGVRRARGRLLVLAAPGDTYLPGAVDAAIDLAARSSAVLVLGAAGDPAGPGDLARVPQVASDLRLGRLVLPHVDDAILDDADPDGVVTAAGLLRAGFAFTERRAYRDDRDAPPPPHSVRPDPLPGLDARIARDRAGLAALDGFDDARAHCAAGALAGLRPFLEVTEVSSAGQWASLSGHARALYAAAGQRVDRVDVIPRVMARLAADGRRDDLVALVSARRFAGADFPTTVVDGEIRAELGVEVEGADLLVAARESSLRAVARRLLVVDGRLVLEVLAGVRHLEQRELPEVHARLRDVERTVPLEVVAATDPAAGQWFGETEHDHDAGLLRLSCETGALEAGAWSIELDWSTAGLVRGGEVGELDRSGSAARRSVVAGALDVRLDQAAQGLRLQVGARKEPDDAVVEAVEVRSTGVHVTVRGEASAVVLEGAGVRVDAVRRHHGSWAVPLARDVWGLGERPLPSGTYRLEVERDGVRTGARLAADQVDRLPEDARTADHRVRLQRADGDGLAVRLDALLADDEIGARAQRRVQAAYLQVAEPLDDRLVYFQSFTGQWANDHPLPIQQELRRRRPDLRVRWLVADSSSTAPPGAQPVLFRSREWYDVLARAGHVVTNIELERWFVRRPEQQILQTFHGYPSKTMGLGLWRARGLLPSHLEQQLDHTSRTWNALLTPSVEMDEHYRREYAYDGRILALGYPRDDVLVGPKRQEVRAAVRRRLGIAPGRRAVLYAPTWRDDLATNFRAAEADHHLDVEQAAAQLGDDYVLLLRGHRFHASTGRWAARVLDVTSYPEVNDLILAADVAVLDYSSMRFDFALTGRPMVFLVPDLDDYGSRTRGFLWDFGETAPGPWVRDTAGVVAELRDLEALADRWAEPLAAFNARYNALQDGHAAERVVADFFADLPEPVSGA